MIPTTAPTTNADGSVDQCESNVINIADVFERGYASYNASKIKKQLAWKADIVILQFGENIALSRGDACQASRVLDCAGHAGAQAGRWST